MSPDAQPLLSVYRRVGARLFDKAARETGLSPGVLGQELRVRLLRPTLTAPTLRAWRRGNKPAPLAAFLACCALAGKRPDEVLRLLELELSQNADGIDEEGKTLLSQL